MYFFALYRGADYFLSEYHIDALTNTGVSVSACSTFLSISIEDEGSYILRDDLTGRPFKFDKLFKIGQRHEAVLRQGSRRCLLHSGRKDIVLEEMGQLLDVQAVIFIVELLEDGQYARDIMRTIYRELLIIVLPQYAIERLIVPQVLKHCQCKDCKEA